MSTKLPKITILDGDGGHVWTGTLTQFARDNSRDETLELIGQWRASLEVNGRLQPAFLGGGASPHFEIHLLTDERKNETLVAIAQRAADLFAPLERTRLDWLMDVDTVHRNVGLRLDELLSADEVNFAHDLGGIYRHLNRATGVLGDHFLPRYAK